MSTPQRLQPHIVFRLVLAKAIFKEGIKFCDTPNDTFGFSHGLIALHDALDNFAGAIVSRLGISLLQKSYLIDALNAIEKNETTSNKNFSLISKNEIIQLNTIRNNIKHQGIVPDANHAKGLVNPIISFFQKYSRRYFKLEWEMIGLADLIENKEIRVQMKNIEGLIENNEYKEALNEMAVIKFKVFEERLLRIELNPRYDISPPSEEKKKRRESSNIFPIRGKSLFSDLYDRADFLEKGIDRNLMNKFEELTARVGINNNKEWKYILKHGINWGTLNWTKEIAFFCYDFLVDAIIKNQQKSFNFDEKWIWTIYTIEAMDEIKIFNKDDKLVYTILKGERRDAIVFNRIDRNWEIYIKSDLLIKLFKKENKPEIVGYYLNEERDRIKFLKTRQYTRDDNEDWILINELEGG